MQENKEDRKLVDSIHAALILLQKTYYNAREAGLEVNLTFGDCKQLGNGQLTFSMKNPSVSATRTIKYEVEQKDDNNS